MKRPKRRNKTVLSKYKIKGKRCYGSLFLTLFRPLYYNIFHKKQPFTQTQTEFCMQHEDKSHAPKTSRPLLGPKTTSVGGLGQRKSENVGTNRKDSEPFGFLCTCRSLGSQSGTCHSLAARREYFPGGGL